jgi:hypothetical protein
LDSDSDSECEDIGVVFAGATTTGSCRDCTLPYGVAVGMVLGFAATPGEATLEVHLEGPSAFR